MGKPRSYILVALMTTLEIWNHTGGDLQESSLQLLTVLYLTQRHLLLMDGTTVLTLELSAVSE